MVFEVKILGSNSASFAYNRHQTSQLMNVNQQLFLVDCGEATQIQLFRYRVRASRINHIFISHLHGDHYLGLIGLLSTLHLQGRTEDLWLFGPAALSEILTVQFRASDTQLNYPIHFRATRPDAPELIYENQTLTVETIPLDHRVPCCGFLFREKPKKYRLRKEDLPAGLRPDQLAALKRGEDLYDEAGDLLHAHAPLTHPPQRQRSYAFCSDTRYDERILPQIEGIDLLYHEATFTQAMAERAAQTYHTTATQAATIAQKAGVDRLLLGHFSSRYRDLNPLLTEARAVFENSHLALEGETFSVEV